MMSNATPLETVSCFLVALIKCMQVQWKEADCIPEEVHRNLEEVRHNLEEVVVQERKLEEVVVQEHKVEEVVVHKLEEAVVHSLEQVERKLVGAAEQDNQDWVHWRIPVEACTQLVEVASS
jgi:gamma-glutamylcysteine synthetase